MKNLLKLIVITSIAISFPAIAHVKLLQATPSKDAMLKMPPELLTLEFNKKVRIVKVALKDRKGEKVNFGFKPSKQSKSIFQWSLPDLQPESYSVEIIYLGNDGHKMKEKYTFMVH
ncbi:copper resistance protein CopC [uncultured Pseudoteredinibacter sp.]|uniref:copper resistance CopC family protein n=1 Tax=uncultured Pseudoteredinibacter sp. TaxID=1641701 RepID=UPI00262ED220|nr:copper resistance protein CopC [uncultured Pseudoteredinibacter sp.]